MPTIQELIQYLTVNGHTSKRKPVTAAVLATHFGISDGGVNVAIRDVIRNAISHNNLIGSSPRGFYLIGTFSELEHNLDSLQRRAERILTRRRNMLQNWNNQNPTNRTTKTDLFVRP